MVQDLFRLSLTSVDYPRRLMNIPDAPLVLYCEGNKFAKLAQETCLAVVGSRRVTPYGRTVTDKLVGELARLGVVIISGLAYGVDGLAHQAALRAGGRTIAVLPTGLDQIYPSAHYKLARDIVAQGGALVSEYPPGTPGLKHHFIARNRIISGLALGVLITEAAERSGSLHTANFALEQGREVMAVPGNITNSISAGTNNLIKAGATPITNTQDVLEALGLELIVPTKVPVVGLSETEKTIVGLLEQGVRESTELLVASRLEVAVFSQTLTLLEINGRIKAVSSGIWALV